MAVQVFSIITDREPCATGNCLGAFTSDIIAGLEHVYSLAAARNVASVNMSLGSATTFTPNCDTPAVQPAIDNLRSIGVATVIAAGNGGSGNRAVGARLHLVRRQRRIDRQEQPVSSFSNVAPFLSLFAPGSSITSSVPGGTFQCVQRHVDGDAACRRDMGDPAPGGASAGVGLILDVLRQTGLPITDTRPIGVGTTIPRVSIFEALGALIPVTQPGSGSDRYLAGTPARVASPVILTLVGSGFVASSAAYWNGAPRSPRSP